jgi:GAF domain-containing protein
VIGALDVQSVDRDAFSNEDSEVLQMLADQVAVVLSNARLMEQTQAALQAERSAHVEASRDAWMQILRVHPQVGYRYQQGRGISPLALEDPHQIESNEAAAIPETREGVVRPIQVRSTVLGSVRARKPAGSGEWTAEELTLLDALVGQVGTALDSARLYQTAQRREVRERLTREITDEIRAAADIEQILQLATETLGRELEVPEVVVRLGTRTILSDPGKPSVRGSKIDVG